MPLDPDDAQLAERDPALPGLGVLLDPARLDELLAKEGVDPPRLRPVYVRYKPGTNCLVGYGDESGIVRMHATAIAAHDAPKVAKARDRVPDPGSSPAGRASPARIYLPEACASISFFPHDDDIPSLARLFGDRRPALLARVFRDAAVAPTGDIVPLAYKPRRRFVARLCSATGPDRVLRFYSSARQERAARAASSLRSEGELRLPRHTGGSKRHRVAAFEWLEGSPLREALRSGAPNGALLEACARALAALHRSSAPARLSDRPMMALRELERGLAALVPRLAGKAAAARRAIESRLEAESVEPALIHGDFYDKQVIVGRQGVGFVDLDDVRRGDVREDLAACIAHWERDLVLGDLPAAGSELGHALVEAYVRSVNGTGDAAIFRLGPHVASALFRLSHHPFRSRRAGWADGAEGILDRALDWAEGRVGW